MEPTKNTIDRLHSGTLADVLDGLGQNGVFPNFIRQMNSANPKFFGRAHTVRWGQVRKSTNIQASQLSTWEQVSNFLVPDCGLGVGRVYVAGTDNGSLITEFALVGGLSATELQARNFISLVFGGAIRDAEVISRLNIPVWGTGYSPADTQGSYRVIETGTWCNVGGQTVNTGDWIFGDATGIVKVLPAEIDDVLSKALLIEDIENVILDRISKGERLIDVVDDLGRL